MNNRVASAGCSIAPQSSSGMVHLTVSSVKSALSAATSVMAGFNSTRCASPRSGPAASSAGRRRRGKRSSGEDMRAQRVFLRSRASHSPVQTPRTGELSPELQRGVPCFSQHTKVAKSQHRMKKIPAERRACHPALSCRLQRAQAIVNLNPPHGTKFLVFACAR